MLINYTANKNLLLHPPFVPHSEISNFSSSPEDLAGFNAFASPSDPDTRDRFLGMRGSLSQGKGKTSGRLTVESSFGRHLD